MMSKNNNKIYKKNLAYRDHCISKLIVFCFAAGTNDADDDDDFIDAWKMNAAWMRWIMNVRIGSSLSETTFAALQQFNIQRR